MNDGIVELKPGLCLFTGLDSSLWDRYRDRKGIDTVSSVRKSSPKKKEEEKKGQGQDCLSSSALTPPKSSAKSVDLLTKYCHSASTTDIFARPQYCAPEGEQLLCYGGRVPRLAHPTAVRTSMQHRGCGASATESTSKLSNRRITARQLSTKYVVRSMHTRQT
jgi:hypothetical protein